MPYWRQYFHIVWATFDRQPLLTPDLEVDVYRVVAALCEQQGGRALAVNGMADHLHVVTTIPPTLSTASFVKNLKGTTSRFVNKECHRPFRWQAGYGVFTISERSVPRAVEYVNRQKQHHEAGQIIPAYERCGAEAARA